MSEKKLRRVYCLGAPGIGKTTIYRELCKEKRTWNTVDEIILKYLNKQNLLNPLFNNYIYNNYLSKYSFFNRAQKYINNRNLKKLEQLCFNKMRSGYSVIFDFAYQGLSDGIKDPVSRMLAVEFFVKMAKREMLVDCYNESGVVIFDDSIWQSMRGNILNSKVNSDSLSKSDAIIYFFSNPEVIFDQIKKRSKIERINTSHYGLDDNSLLKMIDYDVKCAEFKKKYFINSNIPVLDINIQEDISKNVKRIESFLNTLKLI